MRLSVLSVVGFAILASSLSTAQEAHRAFWRGQWVKYVEVEGYAVTEGDIKIGPIAEVREWTRLMEQGERESARMQKALTIASATNLWNLRDASGVVQVPYVITTNVSGVQPAIDEVNRVLAGVLRWIPRTTEVDYVDFNLATAGRGACASFVGRRGGRQEITGDPLCSTSTIVHEMGHALGLWHSQQDASANAFIDFRLDKMEPGSRSNSQPIFGARTLSGYDYASIMHYTRTGFSASSENRFALETKPPGMLLTPLSTYSPGDLDALFRLYGRTPTTTTIHTNPSGLRVVVNGVSTTTPATFNWPIGSVQRIWVEDGLQSTGGFRHAFGRWSHDRATTPSSQLTWQVRAGDGGLGEPTDAPSDTVITANFVRLIDVQTTPAQQTGGSVSFTPQRAPWPGTQSLYPQFSRFTLGAQPASGFEHFFIWDSAFASSGGPGVRRNVTLDITGNTPLQTLGANFHNGAAIALDIIGAGTEDSVSVRVTPPGGSAASQTAPRLARTTPGTWKFELTPSQTVGTSIRYGADGNEGFDDPAAGTIDMPASGVRRAALRVLREVRPFRAVDPSCAGGVTLSDSSQWLRTGSPLSVTLSSNNVGVFTGWSGTLSGTSLTQNISVGSNVPEFVANFNSISEPLVLGSVSPSFVGDETQNTTLILRGSGFTSTSQVWIGNNVFPSTFVDSRTMRVQATRALLAAGRLPIYVRNSLGFSCFASTDALAVDVLEVGQSATATVTEFYNPDLDYYFMTGRAIDKQILDGRPEWRRTGQDFKIFSQQSDGALPFERFFFANAARAGLRGTHFYTSLANEQRLLTSLNTKNEALRAKPFLEGVEGYTIETLANGTCPSQTIPVYRAFRGPPRFNDDANHRFSTSLTQHQEMINRLGWADEGIVFCAVQ